MIRLCALDELAENTAQEHDLEGQGIILVNWFGQIHCWLNDCPHAGWPLNIQPDQFFDVEGRFLQCSNHMALFEPDSGHCVAGPCAGECLTPVQIELREDGIYATEPDEIDPES